MASIVQTDQRGNVDVAVKNGTSRGKRVGINIWPSFNERAETARTVLCNALVLRGSHSAPPTDLGKQNYILIFT